MLWLMVLIAGPDSAVVEAAMHRVVEAGEYQAKLPDAPPDKFEPARKTEPKRPRSSRSKRSDEQQKSAIGSAIIGVSGLVLLVLTVVWISGAYRRRRRPEPLAPAALVPAAAPAAPVPVSRPVRLAEAGRFAEAVHATLLLLLRDVPRAGEEPSWTSREILRRVKLRGDAMSALRDLVLLVERSRFAGKAVSQADYENARGLDETCRKEMAA